MQKKIQVLGKIPKKVILACSGGSDSMAALDFMLSGRKEVLVAYFNHGTEHGKEAEEFIKHYCEERGLKLLMGSCTNQRRSNQSLEEYWREERLGWLESISKLENAPVVTCHHLDDAVEWWVFSSFHGKSKLIPSQRSPFIRPFLLTRKETLNSWNVRKEVPWIEDPSNQKIQFMRNYIRHELIPRVLMVNPGIHKVVARKIKDSHEKSL